MGNGIRVKIWKGRTSWFREKRTWIIINGEDFKKRKWEFKKREE